MIAVVGEALVDLVIEPDGAVEAALGGAPFNTARAAARLGAPTAFVGALSDDRFGQLLGAQLDADGVVTEWTTHVDVPTTLAAAELDEGGAATYRFYLDGTSAPSFQGPTPAEVTTLFTGGLALVLQPMADHVAALATACDPEVLVVVDVNCRPAVVSDHEAYRRRVEQVCGRADVVKVSDDDLRYLSPGVAIDDAAESLRELGAEVVLLTAGGGGVTIIAAGERRTVPVQPVDVVDTIGAGDSFGGAVVAWWHHAGLTVADLADLDRVEAAVAAANVVAGIVCTRRGAHPPWLDELPAGWAQR